jgi:endonuclease YncB( thermonuclease family)
MPKIARLFPPAAAGLLTALVACSSSGAGVQGLPVVPTPGTTMMATAGPYPVVAVLDPATIEVDRGGAGGRTTLRLVGIAAPEPTGCFSGDALAEAERLLGGQQVRLVADPGHTQLDVGGGLAGYVWLESGRMANHLLVEGGFVRAAAGAASYAYRETFANAEEHARQRGAGLWSAGTCSGNVARRAR